MASASVLSQLCLVHGQAHSYQAYCVKQWGLYWDGSDFQSQAHRALWLSHAAAKACALELSRDGFTAVYVVTLTEVVR